MERFMRMAIQQARNAQQAGEVPVGAILVDETGNVLASAHNQPLTLCDPTAHAEILALRAAAKAMGNYRLTGTTLYVTIEPCPMCAGALVHARVKQVVIGAPDPKSGACGSLFNLVEDKRLNHQVKVIIGILQDECQQIIQDFFRQRRCKK